MKKSIPFINLLTFLFSLATMGLLQAQCFTYSNGGTLTDYTIPDNGTNSITITAIGADGGNTYKAGGKGGTVTATFSVSADDIIRVIVGHFGDTGSGGGGTAVIHCGPSPGNCATGTLLLVAGAGGGGSNFKAGYGASNVAGTGFGGLNGDRSGGGGGINSAGEYGSNGGGGAQANNLAVSSTTNNFGGDGYGEGGEIGGGRYGGGGGGYSGGDGGENDGGKGGTNYVDASGTLNSHKNG